MNDKLLFTPQNITIPLNGDIAQYLAAIRYLRCTNRLPFDEQKVVRAALRRGLRQMLSELDCDVRQINQAIQRFCKGIM